MLQDVFRSVCEWLGWVIVGGCMQRVAKRSNCRGALSTGEGSDGDMSFQGLRIYPLAAGLRCLANACMEVGCLAFFVCVATQLLKRERHPRAAGSSCVVAPEKFFCFTTSTGPASVG